MKPFLLVAALFACTFSFAQNKSSVKGTLIDSVGKQQLKSATVNILDKDSVLIGYSIAKEDGSFTVYNVPAGNYLLFVSFAGYETLYRPFAASGQAEINLGTVYLQLKAKDLGNVTVKQSPVTIKGDTTEFNAGSFRTKPNATAEDLFKKLPGVQVDKDGTVKAQGENVKRVLVDGKRFFGDDPKAATKNLPTDIIDKVQVYDAQSDQSAFSGFDDGNRDKTINIITKKDKRKGYFGKVAAGGGTDGRYAANVNLNRFNGNQQIALISQANNVNAQNFSVQDILGVMNLGGNSGGGNRGGGGGNVTRIVTTGGGASGNLLTGNSSGLTRTLAGGLNYNDVWSKNTSVSGSYFYNNINNVNVQDKFRETFTKDTSLFSTTNTNTNNKNTNQRYNFEIDQRIDSFNSLLFRPSGSIQESNNYTRTVTNSKKGTFYDLNNVDQTNTSENNGYNLSNSLLWRHRFAKKGRTISVTVNNSFNNNESNGRNLSYTNAYNSNFGKYIKDTVDQLTNTVRETKTYGGNFSYTEPAGKKGLIELSYNYNHSLSTSDQETQRMNKASGKYDPYTPLTNDFENTNLSHRAALNYRRQINQQWNYTIGLGLQRSFLESVNKTKNTDISQWFTNYTPTLMLQYTKNRTKNLRFNYRGNTQAPSINQLQPIVDITNQLNIRDGNPNLKQSFNHNFNLFYSRFDMVTFRNVFASVNGSFTQNKIGSEYTINTGSADITVPSPIFPGGIKLIPGAQYSRPVNLNGAYNVNGFFTYGIRINKIQGNLNFTSNLSHSKDVNLINAVKSFTKNYSFGETVGFNMNIKEKLDLNLSSTSTFAMARYSVQTAGQNTDYFTQNFSIEPTYTTKDNFVFGVDFDYTKYSGQGEGYNQSIPLLNASISKLLFKNKAGELKFSAFDLLNQNKSITTAADLNYFESVRTTVLKRYVMLTFTYNLRRFGGKQMPGMFNMRQMGGGQMRMGGGDRIRIN